MAKIDQSHRRVETVVIASVNDGVVPLDAAVNDTDDPVVRKESEDQERALFYVAATWAKRQVVCSYGTASRFLISVSWEKGDRKRFSPSHALERTRAKANSA